MIERRIAFSLAVVLSLATLTCSRAAVVVTPQPIEAATSTPEPLPEPTQAPLEATATEFSLPPLALSEVTYQTPIGIRNVTETTATLQFELAQPAPGFLLYRARDQASLPWQWELLDPMVRYHQFTLVDLAPDTVYDVRLGLGTQLSEILSPTFQGEEWAPIEFRTLAPGAADFSVAVIGDSGFGEPVTFKLAEHIAAHMPSFVIHTGDVVYRVDENSGPMEAFALKYFAPFKSFLRSIPLYPVLGNHDVDAPTRFEGRPYYYRVFPGFPDANYPSKPVNPEASWYAIARGPFQFIFLNTQSFYGEPGREEQKAFLRQRLSDGRFAHNILIFHVPPVTSGIHTTDGLPVRSDWEPIYRDSNTRLVLSGHDHLYERLEFSGITHLISGGGSSALYPIGELAVESRFAASRSHFVLLKFSSTSIQIEAIDANGELMDTAIIDLSAQ